MTVRYDDPVAVTVKTEPNGSLQSEETIRQVADSIREQLRLAPTDRLLDVGCGPAIYAKRLAPYAASVSGTDPVASMVEMARAEMPEGHFQVTDAAHLPFEDNSFDKILCYSVFQYFSDQNYAAAAVREMIRVCAPGGRILIGDVQDVSLRHLYDHPARKDYDRPAAGRLMKKLLDLVTNTGFEGWYEREFFRRIAGEGGHACEFLEQPRVKANTLWRINVAIDKK